MSNFTPHEATAHKPQSLPVSVPGKLVGRETSLAAVYGQLKVNKPVLIHGPAGIGKSALAATLAGAYTELPGGTLWLSVDNSPLDELIARVGRAFNVAEIMAADTPLGLVGAVASTLTTHKPLVVLDGKHNPQAALDFVTRCASNLPLMVTANEPFDGPWTTHELGSLDSAPALTLLKNLGGFEGQADVDDNLDEVASILDYRPLALVYAAGTMRMTKQTPDQYLGAFEKIPSSAGATPEMLALTIGFRSLNNALQGIMLVLGATFNGQASAEMLSLLSGAPVDTVQQVMAMLAGHAFVERFTRYEAPHYRLHEVTHNFAQTWLRGSQRLEGLQNKVRDSVVAYVQKYNADSDIDHNKLAAEMDTVMAVARWCAEQGERDVVNQLLVSLTQAGDFVNERGYVHELLTLRKLASSFTQAFPAYPAPPPVPEAMLDDIQEETEDEEDLLEDDEEFLDEDESVEQQTAVWAPPAAASAAPLPFEDEAEALEDDEDESAATITAAAGTSELDRLQMELRQARQTSDHRRQVEILNRLGEIYIERKAETEAITVYTEALQSYEALEDVEGSLRMLDTLSTLMVKTENSGAAVMYATRGINLASEIGDSETNMHLLVTLGDVRQQLGASDEATHAYQQALEIARHDDDSQNEALILFKLGQAQLDNGDPDTASESWEQALKLFKAQGKRDYEGRVLGSLGTAYGELERWTEAINFHTSALHIAREVRDKKEEALQLGYLGDAAVQANQLRAAVLRYRQALHLALESNQRDDIVSNLLSLARLFVESQRHLDIADMLATEALRLEPNDRDSNLLKERIINEKQLARVGGVNMLPVMGTLAEYAANAYRQLEG